MEQVVIAINWDSQIEPTIDIIDAVSEEEALGIAMMRHRGMGTMMGFNTRNVKTPDMESELLEAVREDIKKDRRIAAIKTVREKTGWGLKEAKEWVDEHCPRPTRPDTPF